VKLSDDVDLATLAARTSGFTGADLANLVNEAALLAARKGHRIVAMADFSEAFERVVAGLEKSPAC
jgi:cell division protease FtsH